MAEGSIRVVRRVTALVAALDVVMVRAKAVTRGGSSGLLDSDVGRSTDAVKADSIGEIPLLLGRRIWDRRLRFALGCGATVISGAPILGLRSGYWPVANWWAPYGIELDCIIADSRGREESDMRATN
jgi:hypothetical protein